MDLCDSGSPLPTPPLCSQAYSTPHLLPPPPCYFQFSAPVVLCNDVSAAAPLPSHLTSTTHVPLAAPRSRTLPQPRAAPPPKPQPSPNPPPQSRSQPAPRRSLPAPRAPASFRSCAPLPSAAVPTTSSPNKLKQSSHRRAARGPALLEKVAAPARQAASKVAAKTSSKSTESSPIADLRRGRAPAKSRARSGSKKGKAERKPYHWSAEEHTRFMQGLERFGSADASGRIGGGKVSVGLGPGVAEQIAGHVGTRSVSQVRSHAQKFFLRLHRNAKDK